MHFPLAESAPAAWSRAAARLTLAGAVGLAAGAATERSVPHLPSSLEPLANSAGPWVLVAFAVALTARRTGESMVLAIVALGALVVGFYAAEVHAGWPVSRHQVVFWSAASVVFGPLVGLAAAGLRRAEHTAQALGAGVLGGLLAGEAVYGLTALKFSTPAGYWHLQFALAVGLSFGLPLWRSRRRPHDCLPFLALSLVAGVTIGLATLAAYQMP
jgi:hypothetical protein